LSVFKTLGIPNIEKILSSNGITDFVDTVVKVSSVDLNIVPTIGTVSSKATKLCNEYSEI
jgi:hypothetical protein